LSHHAEIKPPGTFEIKSRTQQAEGTFLTVSAETGAEPATPLERVNEISKDV